MRYLDLILAFVVFVFSASLTALAYRQIVTLEQPNQVFLEEMLFYGNHKYGIFSKNSCFGELELNLDEVRNPELTLDLKVRTSLKLQIHELALRLKSTFNPLGQLTDSDLRLDGPDLYAQIISKNINPIDLEINAQILGRAVAFKRQIPGPIELKEYEKGKIRLQYHAGQIVPTQLNLTNLNDLRSKLQLHIEPLSERIICDKNSSLDLKSVFGELKTLLPSNMQQYLSQSELSE